MAPACKVIPQPVRMTASEFKKLPKGSPGEIRRWAWKKRLKAPCGQFGVELFTDDEDPLDQRMLKLVEELARYAQAHSEYIREIIYGHYRYYVTEYGPDALFSDMPADLEPEQIWKHCEPCLLVSRNPKEGFEGPPFDCEISVGPNWEPEHGLTLEFSEGAIVTVNQGPFKIVNGILRQ